MNTLKTVLIVLVLSPFMLFTQQTEARVTGLPDFTELVEKAGPAVVNIRVTQYGNQVRGNSSPGLQQPNENEEVPEFFRRFFDEQNAPQQRDRFGAGSGFIIDADGYVITNHHVVDGADEIIVRMADRREFEAKLIGSDSPSDIALLKIDAKDLPSLKFGDSDGLKQGEWVVAIGSPFNFDQTVTAGIVSAKGRSNSSQKYVPFIQTDVAINRGNSGGPLINMDGEVVGVNSWILAGQNGGYLGLSFSIPIEVAKDTVAQIRENGSVQRGLLGVLVANVTREMAEALQLDRPVGALVNDVTDGGSAQRAGIEPGDVILEFNQQTVETWNDLPPLVGQNPPGTEATVLISRDGRKREVDVVLDALPTGDDEQVAIQNENPESSNLLGLAVEEVTSDQRRRMEGPEGGVLVTSVDSDAAWRAGIRAGDLILMINNRAVDNVDSFESVVTGLPENRAVALRVWRNGSTTFFAFTPGDEDVG